MTRPCVLVLAGLDPSGGAGVTADVLAIAAQGAHALPVVTALTVQDHNRAYAVAPVEPAVIRQQVRALASAIQIAAVKLGIPGSVENAQTIAALLAELREANPRLPIVLDPVLASGRGDALEKRGQTPGADARGFAARVLLALASVVTPNGPEAAALGLDGPWQGGADILLTGGHGDGAEVVNTWLGAHGSLHWRWPRLAGEFHGSGCTLAAALAGRLALGETMEAAMTHAQTYTHATLRAAFAIGPGQRIPQRLIEAN